MRRSYAFSGPISCGTPVRTRLLGQELRHLVQLASLSRRKCWQSTSTRRSSPSCRRNAVLTMCCSAFSGSPRCDSSSSASSPSRSMRIAVARLLDDRPSSGTPIAPVRLLEKRRELSSDVVSSCVSRAFRARFGRPAPALFRRRSAGGRTCFTTGGADDPVGGDCWPMPSRLLTVQ